VSRNLGRVAVLGEVTALNGTSADRKHEVVAVVEMAVAETPVLRVACVPQSLEREFHYSIFVT